MLLRPEEANSGHVCVSSAAVNQDGRTANLTSPSGPAQQRVITRALQLAGMLPYELPGLDSHGTGTSLGDPIEVAAQHAVLGPNRSSTCPTMTGAVKSVMGHLEQAAGMVGVLKMVTALDSDQTFHNLHLHKLNPFIDIEGYPVMLPSSMCTAPADKSFGISSFGYGGTNAHVTLVRHHTDERLVQASRVAHVVYEHSMFPWWDADAVPVDSSTLIQTVSSETEEFVYDTQWMFQHLVPPSTCPEPVLMLGPAPRCCNMTGCGQQHTIPQFSAVIYAATGALDMLVQIAQSISNQSSLWVCTDGMVGPQCTQWHEGGSMGVVRSIRLELGLRCGYVDGDSQDALAVVGGNVDEIVRCCDGQWAGARLRRLPMQLSGSPLTPIMPSHISHALSGGTGALGSFIALWMVRRGAEHLSLLSRTGRAGVGPHFDLLSAEEVEVNIWASDVSINMCSSWPVGGVVHAAGLELHQSLSALTGSQWQSVLAPKKDGTQNLQANAMGRQLDYFLLFSSASVLFGLSSGGCN